MCVVCPSVCVCVGVSVCDPNVHVSSFPRTPLRTVWCVCACVLCVCVCLGLCLCVCLSVCLCVCVCVTYAYM
jgi:hypothetical protein